MTVPRSKLFVAGDQLQGLSASLDVLPDALSLDLEDMVPAEGKAAARMAVASLLQATNLPCPVWVRVNGLDSGHLIADVLALQGAAVEVINLPKVENATDLRLLEELLLHIEISGGRSRPIGIVPTIETPRGLRNAAAIGAASPRVVALQLGGGDLIRRMHVYAEGLGYDMLSAAFCLGAAEAGVPALDSTSHRMDNLAAFEADTWRAHSLGFQGKSCMLPAHVAIANRIFTSPSPTPNL
jgi:citrate lyase beta subunit